MQIIESIKFVHILPNKHHKGESLYHMKEDFYFHYFLSEKGIKLRKVCVLISTISF